MSRLDPALWRDLVGLPFRSGARGPDAYDCYGLVLEIHRRQGLALDRAETPQDDDEMERRIQAAIGVTWLPGEMVPGATLLFRDQGLARHVGILLGEDRFIHAASRLGQVAVERLDAVRSFLPLIGAFKPLVSA
jgi:cell wall-associated NlpC family hydrolase